MPGGPSPRLALTALFVIASLESFAGTVQAGDANMTADARAACANSDLQPTASNLEHLNKSVHCLINGERRTRRIPKLRRNSRLDRSAKAHADDMVAKKYFSHQSQSGERLADRVRKTGYLDSDTWRLGENLAWATGSLQTPSTVLAAWMNSPSHRRNILDRKFKDIGLAVTYGVPIETISGGVTYVNNLGMVR
jgi:uncharacterized protein YkwD